VPRQEVDLERRKKWEVWGWVRVQEEEAGSSEDARASEDGRVVSRR
jgi:hypothetical protein